MSAPTLIVKAFCVRTKAHLFHLQTGSFSEHIALEQFYTSILKQTDKFAECYMGRFGRITKYPEDDDKFYSEPVKMIADFADWIDEYRDACSKEETELENIVDEMKATCDRALYRLKNLR